jgi:class 3 adenylate cyclase
VRSGLASIEAVSVEPLQVRIGVGTGLVVVGDLVGSGKPGNAVWSVGRDGAAPRLLDSVTPDALLDFARRK